MLDKVDILQFVSYLHTKIELWSNGLPIDTHYKLQIIYDDFYKQYSGNSVLSLIDAEIYLRPRIIAVIAKNEKDQVELGRLLRNWSKSYKSNNSQEANFKKWYWVPLSILIGIVILLLYAPTVEDDFENVKPLIIKHDTIHVWVFDTIPVSFFSKELIDFDSIGINGKQLIHKSDIKDDFSERILFDSPLNKFDYIASGFPSLDSIVFELKKTDSESQNQQVFFYFDIEQKTYDIIIQDSSLFPITSLQEYPFHDRTISSLMGKGDLEHEFIDEYKHWIIPFIALMLSFLLHVLINLKGIKKVNNKKSSNHPYYWKIRLPDKEDISLPDDIERQIHFLRSNIKTGRRKLNVSTTIQETIKKAGYVDFQFLDETIKSSYLFLLNYHTQSDHKAQFWNEMISSLQVKDINVDCFYFNGDVRTCYNDHYKNGLNLTELYNNYPNSVVVLVGGSQSLLNPASGIVQDWVLRFEEWEVRYLLTWKNYFDWDRRESALQKVFHVLPAKLSSIPFLKSKTNDEHSSIYVPDIKEHLIDYSKDFNCTDLNINFSLAQIDWIAACSLYPSLHYDLSIEIGRLVFDYHKSTFTSKEIEQVLQLSWFRDGMFPKVVRQDLLNRIEQNIELSDVIRKYIINTLEDFSPPVNSHAADLFEEALLVSEMLIRSDSPSLVRRVEIRNRLGEIEKNGIALDLQSESIVRGETKSFIDNTVVNTVIEPSKFWSLVSIVPFILFTSFLWNNYVHTVHCVEAIGEITPIGINKSLDLNLFNEEVRNKEQTLYKSIAPIEICKSKLIEDDELIFLENKIRQSIYLGDTSGFRNITSDDFDVEKSEKNIAVDLINIGLLENQYILSKSIIEIKDSIHLVRGASELCSNINLAIHLTDFFDNKKNEFVFEDSLDMALRWCEYFENVLNLCVNINCLNEGKCENGNCICPEGFIGDNCEISLKKISISSFNYDRNKLEFIERLFKEEYSIITNFEILDVKPRFLTGTNTLFYSEKDGGIEAKRLANLISKYIEQNIEIKYVPKESFVGESYEDGYHLYLIGNDVDDQCNDCKMKLDSFGLVGPIILNMPTNIVKYSDLTNGNCELEVTWDEPRLAGICDGTTLIRNPNHSSFTEGNTKVVYTATDICSNTTVESFNIDIRCSSKKKTDRNLKERSKIK